MTQCVPCQNTHTHTDRHTHCNKPVMALKVVFQQKGPFSVYPSGSLRLLLPLSLPPSPSPSPFQHKMPNCSISHPRPSPPSSPPPPRSSTHLVINSKHIRSNCRSHGIPQTAAVSTNTQSTHTWCQAAKCILQKQRSGTKTTQIHNLFSSLD